MAKSDLFPSTPASFQFRLDLASGLSPAGQGMFQEVSGIDSVIDVEELPLGGANRFHVSLPKAARYSNLVLKRGYVTQGSDLARWIDQAVTSALAAPIQTRTISLSLIDAAQQPVMTWTFDQAWPVKWERRELLSQDDAILTEALEFAYTGSTRT